MAPPGGVDKNLLAPPRNYYGAAESADPLFVQGAGGVAGSVTGVLRYDSIRGVAVGGDLGGC